MNLCYSLFILMQCSYMDNTLEWNNRKNVFRVIVFVANFLQRRKKWKKLVMQHTKFTKLPKFEWMHDMDNTKNPAILEIGCGNNSQAVALIFFSDMKIINASEPRFIYCFLLHEQCLPEWKPCWDTSETSGWNSKLCLASSL